MDKKLKHMKFPGQPIGWDETGTILRFRKNKLIDALYASVASKGFSLSDIEDLVKKGTYTEEEYRQFNQLTGYPARFYGDTPAGINDDNWEVYEEACETIEARDSRRDAAINFLHPVQPFGYTENNTLRFKRNRIIESIVRRFTGESHNGITDIVSVMGDLIHWSKHDHEDFSQLLQLLGYTVKEFTEAMSLVTDSDRDREHYIPAVNTAMDVVMSVVPKDPNEVNEKTIGKALDTWTSAEHQSNMWKNCRYKVRGMDSIRRLFKILEERKVQLDKDPLGYFHDGMRLNRQYYVHFETYVKDDVVHLKSLKFHKKPQPNLKAVSIDDDDIFDDINLSEF